MILEYSECNDDVTSMLSLPNNPSLHFPLIYCVYRGMQSMAEDLPDLTSASPMGPKHCYPVLSTVIQCFVSFRQVRGS